MKIDNIPDSIDASLNLEQIRAECLELVQKRAYVSAGVAVIPVPFLDVVVDVGILSQLIPEINARFGLAPDQISVFDLETKQIHWQELRKRGLARLRERRAARCAMENSLLLCRIQITPARTAVPNPRGLASVPIPNCPCARPAK